MVTNLVTIWSPNVGAVGTMGTSDSAAVPSEQNETELSHVDCSIDHTQKAVETEPSKCILNSKQTNAPYEKHRKTTGNCNW